MHTSSRKRLYCDERDRAKKDDCLLVECGEDHKVGMMIELKVREGIPVYEVARNAFENVYLDLSGNAAGLPEVIRNELARYGRNRPGRLFDDRTRSGRTE